MKILAFVMAVVTSVAVSATAADWSFYGSARVSVFETRLDDPIGGDTDNFDIALQSNSRIGAQVKVSDELTGAFEYGASGGGVNLRKLYGEWDFGGGKFLVGQTYAPMNWFYSNQVYGVDNNLNGQGFIYSGREPMLMLTFGNLKVALVEPDDDDLGTSLASEVSLPAVEASYTIPLNSLTIEFAGGYNTYSLLDTGNEYDIDSYVVAAGALFEVGHAFFNGAVFMGENAGNLIAVSVSGDNAWDDGYASIVSGQVIDNECKGFGLVAGYKFNDRFTFEVGYGYAETELDNATSEDEVAAYYANVTVNWAPGVFCVPEIGKFDGKEDHDKETTYYGVKWQINF